MSNQAIGLAALGLGFRPEQGSKSAASMAPGSNSADASQRTQH